MTDDVVVACGGCGEKHETVEDAENCDCEELEPEHVSIEPAAIMRHDGRIITQDSGIYWQKPFDYYWSKPQVAGVEGLVDHWNEKVEDHKVESLEALFAAEDIWNWFNDLLLGVEQAINEAEFEDHPWAFKLAMVELKRRDFEDLQNPEEAAEEVVQRLEVGRE